jgi:hypothetical protein
VCSGLETQATAQSSISPFLAKRAAPLERADLQREMRNLRHATCISPSGQQRSSPMLERNFQFPSNRTICGFSMKSKHSPATYPSAQINDRELDRNERRQETCLSASIFTPDSVSDQSECLRSDHRRSNLSAIAIRQAMFLNMISDNAWGEDPSQR